jgi:hypothetical protein
MERKRLPSEPAKRKLIWFGLAPGAADRVVIPNPRSFRENASYPELPLSQLPKDRPSACIHVERFVISSDPTL